MAKSAENSRGFRINLYVGVSEKPLVDIIIGVPKGKARVKRIKDLIVLGENAELLIQHGRRMEQQESQHVPKSMLPATTQEQGSLEPKVENQQPMSNPLLDALELDWPDKPYGA